MARARTNLGNAPAAGWRDGPHGFGRVSRTLHWMMAALFVWQFTSAILHEFADDTPVAEFFWSMHFNFGIILWLLVLVRGTWGLANFTRRPPYHGPLVQRAAAGAVHFLLYALMVAVPSMAILRGFGSMRGMRFFGLQIFDPKPENLEPYFSVGDDLHSTLGWTLLALIAGHVTMALYHGFIRRDGVLQRMTQGDERAQARR